MTVTASTHSFSSVRHLPPASVVLGIDPGLAILGYGALSYSSRKPSCITYGCITTTPDTDFASRLSLIYQEMLLLIDTHQPAIGAIEKLFFSKNTKTALSVAQARGVTILAFAQRAIPLIEFTPLEIKQAVAGYGRADKKQVQRMTRSLLGLAEIPRPDDAADALAVALCAGATAPYI
ncbi:crossover junction endodeoxyribonuclease RuvC [Candidatus Uhrbacteria bacterium]|nr:crossover junction endodeoxyribonuclease RuvC [Candidatus Uhrbacteria bacterium]